MKNRKGFSLIELLATIVVVGILMVITIFAVSKVIERSKEEKNSQEIKTATLAAKSYMQANKELAPKSIGESAVVTLMELKETKYLTEDVVNAKGESCMDNSYVEVIKTGKSSFDYNPHIYCGDEVPPEGEALDPPVLKNGILFSDSNDVNVASFSFVILGSATDKNMEIASYTYVISTKLDGQSDYQEVYNSGVKNGEHRTVIEVNEKIKKYVDLTGTTSVRLTVLARNKDGGSLEQSAVTGTGQYADYRDTTAPYCEADSANLLQYTQAKVGQWFNRDDYERTKRGKSVQVKCNDSDGSGCLREIFTQTWPNNQVVNGTQPYLYGAKYAWIYIKDNAGNDGPVVNSLPSDWNDAGDANHRNDDSGDYRCLVRVNVDILEPEVTVQVRATENGQVLKTVTAGGLNGTTRRNNEVTIDFNDYGLTAGEDGKQWFNQANSGVGPQIHFAAKDNIELASWTWETNQGGVKSKTTYTANDKKVSTAGDDSKLADFQTPTNLFIDPNVYEDDISFATDGVRWGKLTIKDKAGNTTVVNIRAYVDKTAPYTKDLTVKTVKLTSNDVRAQNGADYTQGTWTNNYIRAFIADTDKKDNVSGFKKGIYTIYGENGAIRTTSAEDPNKDNYTVEKDLTSFVFTNAFQGKNTAEFSMCDNAGNCSAPIPHKAVVWLDTKAPECAVTQSVIKDGDSYSPDLKLSTDGWAGLGEGIKVTATCTDNLDGGALSQSGCTEKTMFHDFKTDISTNKGGAKGEGAGGVFEDAAGNKRECAASQTVKIDHKAPSCSTSIAYSGGDGKLSNGWLSKQESATVTATCSDAKQNNVMSDCKTAPLTHTYSDEIKTSKAGAVGVDNGGQVYDKADNVVNCPADKTVQIDKHEPTCVVTKKSYNKSGAEITPNALGWLKADEYAIVTGTCNDTGGSGCTSTNTKSYKYTTNGVLTTSTAGPNGINGTYTFKDAAGNVSANCQNNQGVYIDAVKPTCTYTNCPMSGWTNSTSLSITYGCTDTGSSCDKAAYGTVALNSQRAETTVGAYTIYDKAGNSTSCASKKCSTPIDTTAPTAKCKLGNKNIEDNGSTDTGGSGIASRQYIITTSTSAPSKTSNKWGSEKKIVTSCGNNTYNYYMIVRDKANNISDVKKCGSKKQTSCCGKSNPKGCTWKTACRNGNTYIYTSSSKSSYAGTVYHWKGSGCSDKLYLITGSGSGELYIESPCGKRSCWVSSCKYAYIYSNCIGGNNSACPYAQCPG